MRSPYLAYLAGFVNPTFYRGTTCGVSPDPSLPKLGEKRARGKESYEETRPALRQYLPTSQNRRSGFRHGQQILWLRFVTRRAPSVWLPVSYIRILSQTLVFFSSSQGRQGIEREIGNKAKGSRSGGPDGSQIAVTELAVPGENVACDFESWEDPIVAPTLALFPISRSIPCL